MRRQSRIVAAAAAALVATAGGVGVAVATSGDDSEPPISGPALEKARAAAIDHLGGGRVTDTEAGDEESLYEVEVTRPDGSRVDVQLDRRFRVVGDEIDRENEAGDND